MGVARQAASRRPLSAGPTRGLGVRPLEHTHGWGMHEAFRSAEAKRLWDRMEIHYTPKHGSWLNMAETELSVLSGQYPRAYASQ